MTDPPCRGGLSSQTLWWCYLSAVWTLVKVVFRLDPRLWTTAMIATEMPAAMRPYSIAVAPDSSLRNLRSRVVMACPFLISPT